MNSSCIFRNYYHRNAKYGCKRRAIGLIAFVTFHIMRVLIRIFKNKNRKDEMIASEK